MVAKYLDQRDDLQAGRMPRSTLGAVAHWWSSFLVPSPARLWGEGGFSLCWNALESWPLVLVISQSGLFSKVSRQFCPLILTLSPEDGGEGTGM